MESNDKFRWEIVESVVIENRLNFWKAILLGVIKPHLINRRLAGAEHIYVCRSKQSLLNANGQLIKQIAAYITEHSKDEIGTDIVKRILKENGYQNEFEEIDVHQLSKINLNQDKQILIVLNKMLPKNVAAQKCTFEVSVLGNWNISFVLLLCRFSNRKF